jgi:hypothetical protein
LPYPKERMFFVSDLKAQWPQAIEAYNRFLRVGVPVEIRAPAEAVVDDIRLRDARPENFSAMSIGARTVAARARPRNVALALADWRGVWREHGEFVAGPPAELLTPQARLRRLWAGIVRRRFYNKIAERDLPPTGFGCFFLHMQPEWTVEALAFEHQDQPSTVRTVAACLPADVELLVKEHPHTAERRSRMLYARIAAIPGVRLLHHAVPTATVLARAAFVVTLTGTVALEAMCCGVPAVVLGDVFYEHFSGITRANDFRDLRRLLASPESLPAATRDEAAAAIAAMISASHEGLYPGDPDDRRNDRAIARAIIAELDTVRSVRAPSAGTPNHG